MTSPIGGCRRYRGDGKVGGMQRERGKLELKLELHDLGAERRRLSFPPFSSDWVLGIAHQVPLTP